MMTTRNVIVWLLIGFAGIAAGCRGPSKTSDKDIVWVDPAEAEELSHGEKGLLGKRSPAAFVDCRNEPEFLAGHIPGAINLPFQDVSDHHGPVLDGYVAVIVYGKDFGDPKADAMSKRLLELGYTDVKTLSGGLQAWTDAGYPVDVVEAVSVEVVEQEG